MLQIGKAADRKFDTHPPMADRLAALTAYPERQDADSGQPATALLERIDGLEMEPIQALAPEIEVSQLRAIRWEDMGDQLYVQRWRAMVEQYGSLVAQWTAADLPSALDHVSDIAVKLRDPEGKLLTRDQRTARARDFIADALALSMAGARRSTPRPANFT
jgi:hypothetical protein